MTEKGEIVDCDEIEYDPEELCLMWMLELMTKEPQYKHLNRNICFLISLIEKPGTLFTLENDSVYVPIIEEVINYVSSGRFDNFSIEDRTYIFHKLPLLKLLLESIKSKSCA